MTNINLKNSYKKVIKKEKALIEQLNNYNTLINSLLRDMRWLGEKVDAPSAKSLLLYLHKFKYKFETKLVSVRFEKKVLSAKINNTFSRLLKSGTIDEIFTSYNEKYESHAIPVNFSYEHDVPNNDVKNVIIHW